MKKNKFLRNVLVIALVIWCVVLFKQQISITEYQEQMKVLSSKIHDVQEELEYNKKYLEEEKAKREAEKIKSQVEDETINKLAKYVHKELGLRDLNCNYDVNKEQCRNCIKRKGK